MEYLGYVAASNPPPNYLHRLAPPPSPPPPPQRSNSTTSCTASTTKKSRFLGGHRRANSSDSSRSRSAPKETSCLLLTSAPFPSPNSAPLPPPAGLQEELQQQRTSCRPRPISATQRNKELPLPPSDKGPRLDHNIPTALSSPPISPGLNAVFFASAAIPSSLLASFSQSSPPHIPPPFNSSAGLGDPGSRVQTTATIEKRKRNKIHKPLRENLEENDCEEGRLLLRQYTHRGWNEKSTDEQENDLGKPHEFPQQIPREHGIRERRQLILQRQLLAQQQQQKQLDSYASILPASTSHLAKTGTLFKPDREATNTGSTSLSTMTMLSSEPPSSADGGGSSSQSLLSTTSNQTKPFVFRNGRTYLAEPSLPYPLPVDLSELHRQSLRSLLLFQVFGGPVCSPNFADKPPTRVLEVACGPAFWSIMCNQYYLRQGHRDISFSGIDIAPIGLGIGGNARKSRSGPLGTDHEKRDMNWRFVHHDIRRMPWPFVAEEFDLIMVKDTSLTIRSDSLQLVLDECIRLLKPGGTVEVWDSDHIIRLLRPHAPVATTMSSDDEKGACDASLCSGTYVITQKTPLSPPLNAYIVEYNGWLAKALRLRSLLDAPCAQVGPLFLQEVDLLTNVSSRRLAIPLSEMRWEREGVGGVVTKDGKTYIETKGKSKTMGGGWDGEQSKKTISPAQSALRHTALLTVVQMIQSLEPILREVSGKSQDEWDGWSGKMMNDLMKENGTFWGECLEVGAWWAQKR